MGFVKLSDNIFGSSIMDESEPTRLCWLFLLAIADRHGVVDETPRALARRFNMDPQHVHEAIAVLEAPDPESRSEAEEGRRLVRLDEHRAWGWRIVNYELYRNARDARDRREYKRRWMANERALEKGETLPYPEVGEKFAQSVDTCGQGVDSVDSRGPMQKQKQKQKQKQTPDSLKPAADRGFERVVDQVFEGMWKQILQIANDAQLPRLKQGKAACRKKWKALGKRNANGRPSPEDVIAYFQAGARSHGWTKDGGAFAPMASSIFNGERWEDGLDSFTNGRSKPGAQPEDEQRRLDEEYLFHA